VILFDVHDGCFNTQTHLDDPRISDATAEKQTRGGLKAGVDHAVNAKTIVVSH
jgi:hypothetical protein